MAALGWRSSSLATGASGFPVVPGTLPRTACWCQPPAAFDGGFPGSSFCECTMESHEETAPTSDSRTVTAAHVPGPGLDEPFCLGGHS